MVDPITNMPIIILRDKDEQRVLPIWVGVFEANAIALQIENVTTPRPMTHDLLRNVIHDLKADDRRRSSCRTCKDNTFYALIYLRSDGEPWRSTRGRATPSPWRSARGRPSSWRTRSSTTRRPWTSRPSRADSERLQKWLESLDPDDMGSTRCSRRPNFRLSFASSPLSLTLPRWLPTMTPPPVHSRSSVDDRRHRQPEGWRRQDHHRHQPGSGPGAARQADAAHRSGSAGQQHDVVPGRHHARRAACTTSIAEPNCTFADIIVPVDAAEPLGRAVADRARQARIASWSASSTRTSG